MTRTDPRPCARPGVPRAWGRAWRAAAAALLVLGLFACGGVRVKPADEVPRPLVDELPLRAGVVYTPEFRDFVHTEERWNTSWSVELGGANVTKLDRLLRAMFPSLVEVRDLSKPPQPPEPPLDLILEPRFEEYAFLTPRDAAADYYAVSIKYRANVYDGEGRLIDSLVYTGYGNSKSGGLTTARPLMIATQKAMRDAGAKFATEFPAQETVQKLLRGERPEPIPLGAALSGGLQEVEAVPAPSAAVPAVAAAVGTSPAVPAGAAAPAESEPAPPPSVEPTP